VYILCIGWSLYGEALHMVLRSAVICLLESGGFCAGLNISCWQMNSARRLIFIIFPNALNWLFVVYKRESSIDSDRAVREKFYFASFIFASDICLVQSDG